MLFHISFKTRTGIVSYTETALISISAVALYERKPWKPLVEWPVRRHIHAMYTSRMHYILLWVSMWSWRTPCEERIYGFYTTLTAQADMQIRTNKLRVQKSNTLYTAPHGSVFPLHCIVFHQQSEYIYVTNTC
jgi:hypothetical protein